MAQAEYDTIEAEIQANLTGTRTESVALLAWFLQVVWRIEPEAIDDSICDGGGDKGIDAIVVDDDSREITIFQSKHRKTAAASQGDADLKTLVGAAAYFKTPATVNGLLDSKPNAELRRLIQRLNIRDKVAEGAHVTKLVFVTNAPLDHAGHDYVKAIAAATPPLEVWDRQRLASVAERTRRPRLRPDHVTLIAAAPPTTMPLDTQTTIAIALIDAEQLVQLPGIDDQSIFGPNVRLNLGRTRINRELAETVKQAGEHSLFPAYHNGLTMLTHTLHVQGNHIELQGLAVVNGCQSLTVLHQNMPYLTPTIKLLVKIVEVDETSDARNRITYRTNNQNPIDIRDQRSTDPIQRALQAQMKELYGGILAFGIRDGEHFSVPVLDNQIAAQLVMAVYLREPWAAVRKVRLFDQDYHRIFGKDIDAHRLYFLNQFNSIVESVRSDLRPDLMSSFASVRFTIAYLLSMVVKETGEGRKLIANPERWLPDLNDQVTEVIRGLATDVVDSINFYIKEQEDEKGEDFDPKTIFKSRSGVTGVEHAVLHDARIAARRQPNYLFRLQPVR